MDEIGENLLRRREKINIIGTITMSFLKNQNWSSTHYCAYTGNMQRTDDVAAEGEVQALWLFATRRYCIHLLDVWNMSGLHFSGTCVLFQPFIKTSVTVVDTLVSKLKSKSNVTSPRANVRRKSIDNPDMGFNVELDHVRPSKLYNPMLSIGTRSVTLVNTVKVNLSRLNSERTKRVNVVSDDGANTAHVNAEPGNFIVAEWAGQSSDTINVRNA